MSNSRVVAIVSIVISMAGVLVFVGNGCSGQFQTSEFNGVTPVGGALGDVPLSDDPDYIPGTKVVSVVYGQQIMDQLSSCIGVQEPSNASQAMYQNKKGQISVYGQAGTITSPMMMAVASVAGELCNDLITQESKGMPRIFVGFDLGSNSVPSDADLSDAITRLALSCWQRPDNNEEREILKDGAYSISNGEPMAAKKTALMVCTSMLSSLASLTN